MLLFFLSFLEKPDTKNHDNETSYFYIGVGIACTSVFIIAAGVAFLHVHSMPKVDEGTKHVLVGR